MNEVDLSKLSKKERKELKREMERQRVERKGKINKIVKWAIVVLLLLLIGFGVWWALKELSKPLPGQQVSDQGREHVEREKWEKFSYNSNPPTSGPHDSTPLKAGIYEQPQGDGHLIHSLEHGHVIISYHCDEKVSGSKYLPVRQAGQVVSMAYAHELEESTDSAVATPSNTLKGDAWGSQDCQTLKKQLSDLANEKRLWKLIVVPRQNLDAKIALTAWTRIEKLSDFDKDKISAFIDSFRDQGPEKTAD